MRGAALGVLLAVGCSGKSQAPTEPAAPQGVLLRYGGPAELDQAIEFRIETSDGGRVLVDLTARVTIEVEGDETLRVRYEVREVSALELEGSFAPEPFGSTLDARRNTLSNTAHKMVIDRRGAMDESASDKITRGEHEALGPGLHGVLVFLGLPPLPSERLRAGKAVRESEGIEVRLEGVSKTGGAELAKVQRTENRGGEENVEGVPVQWRDTQTSTLDFDVGTGLPRIWRLTSDAEAIMPDGENTHHATMTSRYGGV